MVSLFRRRQKEAPRTGPSPAEMRGRAAEIADPGALDWAVVWEALKTEPPVEDPATLTQELGLDQEREIPQGHADMPATEFSGTRHGRHVALRLGVVPFALRGRGFYEVHVEAAVAPFRAEDSDGRLIAEPGAVPEVEEVLAGLEPAPTTWRKLVVEGGPEGILARRPVSAHSQGYVYDLWLVERLAERLGA
jgi:hypothetical protein